MGCNPRDQDHQTDPQHEDIKIFRAERGLDTLARGDGAKLPWGHMADQHSIDKHVGPRPSIDLPGLALRFLALFTKTPPCSQTPSGGYNDQTITFVFSIES